jgi:prefoldin subunit 5
VKELDKTIQDIKMEIETITKSQRETTLEIENLGKRSGVIDAQMQASRTEYKRLKRESQVQKIP